MQSSEAAAPIEVICESHLTRDAIGPLITFVDGRWAYCAGNGDGDHLWRRRAAVSRDMLRSLPDRIRLMCDDERHLGMGLEVEDGDGMLTLADGKWAYCSASREEPHTWREVDPVEFDEIDHQELVRAFDVRA